MITLRRANENDASDYARLQKDVWLLNTDNAYYEFAEYYAKLLKEKGRISFVVLTEDTGDFCGQCAVRNADGEKPEIEIELLKKHHNKGVGFLALSKMMKEVSEQKGVSCFFALVEPDNIASQKLMYKLGGVPRGVRKSIFLHKDEITEFERKYLSLIDDKIIGIAKMYGVEPQTLLSRELVIDISFPLKPPTISIDFPCYANRELGMARRKFSFVNIANKVLKTLESADASNFDEVKAEIEKLLKE